ncbi:hypothetical protein V5P93_004884 [Actinokineospora auranticolor]|uniref:Uncharacterized protein n=1 Tax=Actinokineospora auranticolor TaxID=155976 RepID=A0A2S6GNT5_9PSEU|nr:hypothetical protein [Actinokineospora auranticolor]PPK66846.1 hypothetical protein CLV40_109231 [Actinokineospora auranticolor]
MTGTRAEIAKLARLLGDPPERFAYLAALPAADVRVVRERATDVLFGANRQVFDRIAAASRLVPSAITAAIAQRTFGPLLSARVAGALEPSRAVDLAGRLPVPFLADVAAELDPRRIADVLALLPVERVLAVGKELLRRRDHITMGRFVADLPAPTLRATITILNEESLLRTAVYSESVDRFPVLFALLPDERLPAVAHTLAAADAEFAEDVYPLLPHLDPTALTRLAAAVRTLPAAERTDFAALAETTGVLDRLGSLAEVLS